MGREWLAGHGRGEKEDRDGADVDRSTAGWLLLLLQIHRGERGRRAADRREPGAAAGAGVGSEE